MLVYLTGIAVCFPGLIFIIALMISASKSLPAPGACSGEGSCAASRRPGPGPPSGMAPPGRGETPGQPSLVKNLQKLVVL